MLAPAAEAGGDDLLLLANGTEGDLVFELPGAAGDWQELLDTAREAEGGPSEPRERVASFSLRLLRRPG